MAKDLKAKVSLETSSAEARLKALTRAINKVQAAVDRTTKNNVKLTTNINRSVAATNKLDRAANKTAAAIRKQATAQNQVTAAVNKTNQAATKSKSIFTGIAKKLKGIAAAYLGVMGAQVAISTSDTITKAENKLNYLNNGDAAVTQSQLDKMYVSSQKVRMGYADMMANVSKSMTLAGGAFGGNMDNAIRFQEIMSEAYTLGGASAQEMSSSMYQMIQALGSGRLQGDELRSVREGAPLAYQKIEEFAKGVYGAEENLKDLASQGKITSDLVVAAIMNAGTEMDAAFAETEMTFEQAWTSIKNTATKAFEPVLQKINDILNSETGKKFIAGISNAIEQVAKIAMFLVNIFEPIFTWFVNNWYWVQYVVYSVITVIILALLALGRTALIVAVKVTLASIGALWPLYVAILVIGAIIAILHLLGFTFSDIAGFIVGIVFAAIQVIINILLAVLSLVVSILTAIVGSVWAVIATIVNAVVGLWNTIKAIGTNIGIAMSNPWEAAKAAFWDWVADLLEGIKWLEPALNGIAKLFGAKGFTLSGTITDARAKANAATSKLGYVDTSFKLGNVLDPSSVANFGMKIADGLASGIQDPRDTFAKGYEIGSSGVNWLGDKISGLTTGVTGGLPDLSDPANALATTGLDPSSANAIGDTADNTGKMADSMELAEEDLAFLKDVANMEWKKEFTTAEIKVDMSNYNTINGDSDLDGIVTRLTNKLYEELDSVANGVYAY